MSNNIGSHPNPEQKNMFNQFYNNAENPFSYNQRKSSDADYKKKRKTDDENQLTISMDNVSFNNYYLIGN